MVIPRHKDVWEKDREENRAIDKLIKTNPVCAEAVFDNMIGTNGKEEDSKDLIVTLNLTLFEKVQKQGNSEISFIEKLASR